MIDWVFEHYGFYATVAKQQTGLPNPQSKHVMTPLAVKLPPRPDLGLINPSEC